MNKSIKGLVVASAVASMFSLTALAGDKAAKKDTKVSAKVRCEGVNECKAKGECGGANGNACAGTNECKGKGWIQIAEKDCKAKGGKVL